MIKQFKSNIALVYAFSIVFTVVVSLGIFFKHFGNRYNFFNWYARSLAAVEGAPLLDFFLTIVVVLTSGYLINRAFNKTSLYNKTTGFPIFIFLLVLSTFSGFYFDSSLVIHLLFACIFLIIIALDQNKSAIHISFQSGILLGISFLFSFWLIPAGLIVFYSLLIVRPFKWREWLVGILGMSLPAVYLFSMRFLFLNNYAFKPKVLDVVENQLFWYDQVSYVILVLIVLWSLVGLRKQFKFQSNVERKQISILAFFTTVTFFISAAIYWIYKVEYFIFVVPLTLMISLAVVNMKRDKFLNILMFVLLIFNLLRIFAF